MIFCEIMLDLVYTPVIVAMIEEISACIPRVHDIQIKRCSMKKQRTDKINYYLDIAEAVAMRGTCLRRKFGAIIVKNDQIISTGYVGAPRGRDNCCDLGYCTREKFNIPRGERYELCRSVHAEANAIISASRTDMIDGTLYLVGIENNTNDYTQNANSCAMCKRLIINAGISSVIIRDSKEDFRVIRVYDSWVLEDESKEAVLGY